MFRPSTAPRWKTATRTFLRGLGASAAYRARVSQAGAEPAPNAASAELFRKNLRENILLPLKLRRSDYQPGDESRTCMRSLFSSGLLERRRGFRRNVVEEHPARDFRRVRGITEAPGVYAYSGDLVLRQRQGEIHPREKRCGVDPIGVHKRVARRLELSIERFAQIRDRPL